MTPFDDYHQLIVRYHRALIAGDEAALSELLTPAAVAQRASGIGDAALPLSDDITVDGFALEGNGALARVDYSNHLGDAPSIRLSVALSENDGELRVAQAYPTRVAPSDD